MRQLTAFILCIFALATAAQAQSTAFTYQGSLKNGDAPANGVHDFRFRLFDAATAGNQVGTQQCIDNLTVAEGIFNATLDFGQQFASTAPRFVEIEVRQDTGLTCANTSGFVALSPRQLITAVPLANHAKSAFSLDAPDGSHPNALVVDNAGRVGIGTTSPSTLLHLRNTSPAIILQDTASAANQSGYLGFWNNNPTETAWVGFGTPGSPHFSIVNARSGGHIALLPFGGNVGIGTSTPTAKLHVAGTLSATNIGADSLATNSVFSSRTAAGPSITGVQSVQGSTAILGQISVSSLTAANAVMGNSGCSTANCFGVFANGRLGATGTKSFRIDHPDAPSTHYLFHYSSESPEAINFYRGTATLDSAGRAVVVLPAYFAKINADPSYQLTAIGAPMPALHVSIQVSEHALRAGALAGPEVVAPACWFTIDGGVPFGQVSWRVDAVRNDEFVRRNGAPVETEKPAPEIGTTAAPLANVIPNRE